MVRIPRIQQVQETADTTPTGRINLNVRDQSSQILQQTGAVTSLVEKGADIYQQYENDKINQLTSEADKEYSTWQIQKLQQLKNVEGDPTDAYAKFEVEEKEKQAEILSKYSDVSSRVKRHLTGNLGKISDKNRLHVLKQRGAHQEAYKNSLYESDLKLKKDSLPVNASYVQSNDPGSFLPFDQNLADIKTTVAIRGVEKGTVEVLPDDAKTWTHIYPDADGKMVKVKMSPIAKARAAKEMSDGVKTSIENMIAAGQTEQAKTMMDRYKSYIDPKGQDGILKKLNKEEKQKEAYKVAANVESKGPDNVQAAIDLIKDPEIKTEVLKITAANTSRRNTIRKNKENANYERLSGTLNDLKRNGQIHGIADLEKHPVYKATWDNLNSKQQKAIIEEFDSPKKTDQKQLVKVHDILLGNDPNLRVEDMSAAQFQEQLVGLSESDKRRMSDKFLSRKSKKGKSEFAISQKVYKTASSMLKQKLIAQELIEMDGGKIEEDDALKLNQAYDDLTDFMDGFDENLSRKQISDYVDQYIKQATKSSFFGSSFQPGGNFVPPKKPQGTPRAVTTRTPRVNPLEGLDSRRVNQLRFAYMKQFNRSGPPAPTDPAFLKYVEESK